MVLQNKGNRPCYVHLMYDVCEVKASQVVFTTTSKKLFQGGKELTGIVGCRILFTYILNLLVAVLDTYSQVMVVPKAKHVYQSPFYEYMYEYWYKSLHNL